MYFVIIFFITYHFLSKICVNYISEIFANNTFCALVPLNKCVKAGMSWNVGVACRIWWLCSIGLCCCVAGVGGVWREERRVCRRVRDRTQVCHREIDTQHVPGANQNQHWRVSRLAQSRGMHTVVFYIELCSKKHTRYWPLYAYRKTSKNYVGGWFFYHFKGCNV